MATYTYESGTQPTIRLHRCDSDIAIMGVDGTTIELATSADDTLEEAVTQTEQALHIEAIEDRISLRVPRGAQIEIEQQGGDVLVQDVASVRLANVGGDIKLRGIAGAVTLDSIDGDVTIERADTITGQYIASDVRCVAATALKIEEVGSDIRVVDIPSVEIDRVGGDAHIVGAQERCQLGSVDGDLRIRNAGTTTVRTVAGDFAAEQIGALEVESIEGDCNISSAHGRVTIRSISSDLNARIQHGPLHVANIDGDARIDGVAAGLELSNVGGDLDFRAEPLDGATYQAHVDGDATISLPANCNLTIEAQVEGNISGLGTSRGRRPSNPFSTVLGSGAAQLTLSVDGDLAMRGAGLRAQPRVLEGARTAEFAAARPQPATGATVRIQPEPQRRSQQAIDEERLALLRMLAEGRISVDEAERLLATVDDRGSNESRRSTGDANLSS